METEVMRLKAIQEIEILHIVNLTKPLSARNIKF